MRYEPALDGIRAIAVLIVIVSHAGLTFVPGGFGVTVFFFLSGYLITTLMRHEAETTHGVDLKQFYLRRFLRIFPPLYITIAVALLLTVTGVIIFPFGNLAVLLDTLFLTNYAALWTDQAGVPMPLWSLDVEEHYYLLFPALFVLLHRNFRLSTVALVIAAICVATLVMRIYYAATLPYYFNNFQWTHTRIDSILFGAILAVWNNPKDSNSWRPRIWHVAAATVALLATLVIRDSIFRETLRYSMQGMALFVIFAFVLHDKGRIRSILSSWPLKWIGLFSYTLYLCHVPALMAVHNLAPQLGTLGIAVVAISISLAYAAAMYMLVEKPLARWRKALHKTAVDSATSPALAAESRP